MADAAENFERELRAMVEDSYVGRVYSDAEVEEDATAQFRASLVRGLEQRAVPREWWMDLVAAIDGHLDEDGIVLFDVPVELAEWMRRDVVRYDRGQPPV